MELTAELEIARPGGGRSSAREICSRAPIRIMDSKPSSSACGHPSSSTDSKLHRISDRDVQLHIWQKAAFADNGTGGRETADSIRLRLTQLECCYAKE